MLLPHQCGIYTWEELSRSSTPLQRLLSALPAPGHVLVQGAPFAAPEPLMMTLALTRCPVEGIPNSRVAEAVALDRLVHSAAKGWPHPCTSLGWPLHLSASAGIACIADVSDSSQQWHCA